MQLTGTKLAFTVERSAHGSPQLILSFTRRYWVYASAALSLLRVIDLARSASFYDAVLAPHGYVRARTHETADRYKEAAVGYEVPGAFAKEKSRSSVA